jgi:meiosis-specific protein HOP1
LTRKGNRFHALTRGRKDEIDGLLNDLERGVFDALEKRFLLAVRISVSEFEARPNCAMESYTFTFAYLENADGSKELDGITMKGHYGGEVTVQNTQQGMQKFNRQLVLFCNSLPTLPRKTRSLHLF